MRVAPAEVLREEAARHLQKLRDTLGDKFLPEEVMVDLIIAGRELMEANDAPSPATAIIFDSPVSYARSKASAPKVAAPVAIPSPSDISSALTQDKIYMCRRTHKLRYHADDIGDPETDAPWGESPMPISEHPSNFRDDTAE